MYVADLKRALDIFGPRLYQLYGQGESPMTITGLAQRLHGEREHPRWRDRLASCGYARSGVLIRVVDDQDRDLPPGEIGEVIVASLVNTPSPRLLLDRAETRLRGRGPRHNWRCLPADPRVFSEFYCA
jgi:acyl-CoA synthetase (AMP-forming)/AMP-acid ligase II